MAGGLLVVVALASVVVLVAVELVVVELIAVGIHLVVAGLSRTLYSYLECFL